MLTFVDRSWLKDLHLLVNRKVSVTWHTENLIMYLLIYREIKILPHFLPADIKLNCSMKEVISSWPVRKTSTSPLFDSSLMCKEIAVYTA